MKPYQAVLISICILFTLTSHAEVNFDQATLDQIESLENSGVIRDMSFSTIEPGEFMMGSPNDGDDERQHKVVLTERIEVQQTEVTQFHWFKIMGKNPSKFKNKKRCPGHHTVFNHSGKIPVCLNMPVETVSWNDVQKFIRILNSQSNDGYSYRLPTEAEWEFAARAGTKSKFYCGENDNCLMSYGIFDENRPGSQPAAVGSLLDNAFGLYDMHGNVWEWVEDAYTRNYEKLPSTNPANCLGGLLLLDSPNMKRDCLANSIYRVIRGGGYSDPAQNLRSALRSDFLPNQWFKSIGFRLVRTPQ